MAIIFLCIILSLISIQLLFRKLHKKHGKKKHPPIVATVLDLAKNFHRLHDYMSELSAQHKTFRIYSPLYRKLYTSDPANVEYMLKTNFENYAKGTYNYSILKDLLGDGIFTVDGDKWREQRKLSSYEFSTRVLRDFSSVVFRKNVVKLANMISEASSNNKTMDMQDLFMRSTLDSIFRVAFGVDLDTMCGSYEEGVKFSSAFNEANAMTLWRYVDSSWKIKRALYLGSEATLKKNLRVVDEFVYKLISGKREKMHKGVEDQFINLKKDDILSRFLDITETDPKYLRDIILNFIIAGKDTTATTMSWFIYMLCKHPHAQERIAKEIKDVIKSEDVTDFLEFTSILSEDALRDMHYLHAALTETLRLYPAVPTDPKICMSDDTLPDGHSVKKGDLLFYQPYAMGRMTYIWGEDAREFKPERWLDESGCFKPESPFKFPAFQAGQRTCLGREFAYRQMKIFGAVLLRFFTFKLGDEGQVVKYRPMISLHIDGGLNVRAIPRLPEKST